MVQIIQKHSARGLSMGNISKKVIYRTSGIFSVCAYPDCPTLPSVNVQGSATPLFCRKHKSDDMVNVIANCAPNQNAPRNRALMFKAAPRPYFAASTNPLFSHFRTHLCRYSTLKVTEWTSFRLFSRKYSSKTLDNSCMSFWTLRILLQMVDTLS